MADLRALVIAMSALLSGGVHAGYAQLAPPPGWLPGGGLSSGAGGVFNFGNAANTAQLVNGTVRTNAALNVGGRAVQIPAVMRFAANAPKVAAGIVFANPTVRAIVVIGGWLLTAKLAYDSASGQWVSQDKEDYPISDGYLYTVSRDGYSNSVTAASPDVACAGFGAGWAASNGLTFMSVQYEPLSSCRINVKRGNTEDFYRATVTRSGSDCPVGWYVTPAGCLQTPPPKNVDEEEFLRRMQDAGMPAELPKDFPHPLPIRLPEVQPTFIPTGNPVPNPNYNPSTPPGVDNQPWNQPGVRVTPAPTTSNPWQVDVQPVDRPVDKPDPNPDPKPDPGPGDGDKPSEKDPGLCDMYPDIVACQKLGNIDAKELPKKTVSMSINKENIGPENGVCPAPRQFEIMGKQMAFQWDLLCDFANGIRPLLIGFAWLSAALAFVGLTRRGD